MPARRPGSRRRSRSGRRAGRWCRGGGGGELAGAPAIAAEHVRGAVTTAPGGRASPAGSRCRRTGTPRCRGRPAPRRGRSDRPPRRRGRHRPSRRSGRCRSPGGGDARMTGSGGGVRAVRRPRQLSAGRPPAVVADDVAPDEVACELATVGRVGEECAHTDATARVVGDDVTLAGAVPPTEGRRGWTTAYNQTRSPHTEWRPFRQGWTDCRRCGIGSRKVGSRCDMPLRPLPHQVPSPGAVPPITSRCARVCRPAVPRSTGRAPSDPNTENLP